MPELPEVDMFRQDLDPVFSGSAVLAVRKIRKDIWVSSEPLPAGRWTGGSLARHGKILVMGFLPPCSPSADRKDGWFLLSRFGMSGSWKMERSPEKIVAHAHLEIRFSDREDRLLWIDPRRFGRLEWTRDLGRSRLLSKIGPDAVSIVPDVLLSSFKRSSRPVRAALMDQAFVAGVGNIYAAEILFRSGINPFRKACDLSMKEIEILCVKMKSIMADAMASGGSSIHSYTRGDGRPGRYQEQHLVYGREGLPCVQCGIPIRKVVQDARSLYYCPFCQGSM